MTRPEYDFDIAEVGDRIAYTEDTDRGLEVTGELVHLVDREEAVQVGVAQEDSRFDPYWVIPKTGEAFDYTVELEEWDDD